MPTQEKKKRKRSGLKLCVLEMEKKNCLETLCVRKLISVWVFQNKMESNCALSIFLVCVEYLSWWNLFCLGMDTCKIAQNRHICTTKADKNFVALAGNREMMAIKKNGFWWQTPCSLAGSRTCMYLGLSEIAESKKWWLRREFNGKGRHAYLPEAFLYFQRKGMKLEVLQLHTSLFLASSLHKMLLSEKPKKQLDSSCICSETYWTFDGSVFCDATAEKYYEVVLGLPITVPTGLWNEI